MLSGAFVRPVWRRAWQDALSAAFVLSLAVLNAVLLPRSLDVLLRGDPAVDWMQFLEGGQRVFEGNLYETSGTYGFRYSPVVGYLFAGISAIGEDAWRLLHVAGALALPTWPMRLVTLGAWPFSYDVETGNVLVFVLVAAAWALRGNAVGGAAFMALALLFPRPLMLPVLAWMMWKQPAWRLWLIAAVIVHGLIVLASGWAYEWISLLLTLGAEATSPNNLGPTRWLGAWWLILGIPLAIVLAWRGRLGWASLAMSYPYVLPYYLLLLVLEVPDRIPLRRPWAAASARTSAP